MYLQFNGVSTGRASIRTRTDQKPLKTDLPVHPPFKKYFHLHQTPKHLRIHSHPVPLERGVGHRHERWVRDAVDAAASSREGIAGRVSREHSARRVDERRFNVFTKASADMHLPAKPLGENKSRTAKPCGPGTRCWCQVGGGLVSPTGSDKTFNPPMTVTRRIRRRGERGIRR
jgi:hypothetical protein